MEKGNAEAFNHFGVMSYTEGDYQRANELYLKGGELGCSSGYKNLGDSYYSEERGVSGKRCEKGNLLLGACCYERGCTGKIQSRYSRVR